MNDHREILKEIQDELHIKFINKDLLLNALTHKSYAIEKKMKYFNERLEFLGDSIISSIVAEFLYSRYPQYDEGKLSRMKSYLVSRVSLVHWAKRIRIGKYILLSRNEESSGGKKRASLLANVFEALIGALYLDRGYEVTRSFILQFLSKLRRVVDIDYKSKLQEIIQQKLKNTPDYRIVQETGPDHNKVFKIEVLVKKRRLGVGSGKSKKEAEQAAAHSALKIINTSGLP